MVSMRRGIEMRINKSGMIGIGRMTSKSEKINIETMKKKDDRIGTKMTSTETTIEKVTKMVKISMMKRDMKIKHTRIGIETIRKIKMKTITRKKISIKMMISIRMKIDTNTKIKRPKKDVKSITEMMTKDGKLKSKINKDKIDSGFNTEKMLIRRKRLIRLIIDTIAKDKGSISLIEIFKIENKVQKIMKTNQREIETIRMELKVDNNKKDGKVHRRIVFQEALITNNPVKINTKLL